MCIPVLAKHKINITMHGVTICHFSCAYPSFHTSIYSHQFLPSVPEPILSASPTGIQKPGSSVNLTCEATLPSEVDSLKIIWNGPRISRFRNDAYNITESHSDLEYTSLLNIQNLEEADEGNYTCTFENFDLGTIFNGSIFLDVQGE